MYMSVSFDVFVSLFSIPGLDGHFSHEALEAIYAHLEEIEVETDKQIEINPAAILRDFTESPSLRDSAENNGFDVEGMGDDDIFDLMALNGLVLLLESGGVVFSNLY